jgi:hypothetical protein
LAGFGVKWPSPPWILFIHEGDEGRGDAGKVSVVCAEEIAEALKLTDLADAGRDEGLSDGL